MKKNTAVFNAILLSATLAASGVAFAHGSGNPGPTGAGAAQMGPGTMGSGMMNQSGARQGMMMGSGKMGGGIGHGMGHGMMMGGHYGGQNIDRNLSAEDVRKVLEGHFAWMGHKRLKVGNIKKQDDGTLLANIDTVDGSLVMRMEVDPKSGAMHPVNE